MGNQNNTPGKKKSRASKKEVHNVKKEIDTKKSEKEVPRFTHEPYQPITNFYYIDETRVLGKGNFSTVFFGNLFGNSNTSRYQKDIKIRCQKQT